MDSLEAPALPAMVGDRYRVARSIGQGGMATVYEATDVVTGRQLALKRMREPGDADRRRRVVGLFEREFHALSQLAHPRVVAVYDYGLDGNTPYYTMELLDGGDLQEIVPLAWRKACAIARDVCSALSLLHSRRFVHRDLSPRNVRCTTDGLAKLIDFGGMAPMGASKQLVGTAAFCAPEVVELQQLDARADIYSLGATLYFTLAGRRAYPARDFAELRELWRKPPRRPSEFVPEIPPALDELVMDLLQLDAARRPGTAAEVMERLSGIAELSIDEQLPVAQAYLSTPTLVGREEELARMRKKLARAERGRGAALLVRGSSGLGRSRLLDACVLDAKLAGALVLRGHASESAGTDYGVLRMLAGQLLECAPEAALSGAEPRLGVLGHALPELLARRPHVMLQNIPDPQQRRARVQAALREWLSELARQRLLVLAVDDVHRADEPSAACLALFAHELARARVLLLTTLDAGAAPGSPALALLAQASTQLSLRPLGGADVEKLLCSVFGDVPNLRLVADRLHTIANGNPRDVMRLAQHLLDQRLVRYRAGAWSLPGAIDQRDLPASMAHALEQRVAALGADARELARALALAPDQRFRFDECLLLTAHADPGRLMQSLDELMRAEIVRPAGDAYIIAQQGWIAPLCAELDRPAARALHARLALLFERRGTDGFRQAQHLLHAGDEQRGVDLFVALATAAQDEIDKKPEVFYEFLRSLPADWLQTFERVLQLCKEQGRPRRQRHAVLTRLSGTAGVVGLLDIDVAFAFELVEQLQRDSGLDLYAALGDDLEPKQRLARSLELAAQRYRDAPEHERVFEPLPAIRQLARAMIASFGVVASSNSLELWSRMPSLAPYAPLSPALAVIELLRVGVGQRMTGRTEAMHRTYEALLARLSQPDRAGLDESHGTSTKTGVMVAQGMLEAEMGLRSSLEHAAELEPYPMHAVNVMQIRMVYHLWQGDTRAAAAYQRQAELLRVQNRVRQLGYLHGPAEICGAAAIGDLVRIKQVLDELEPLAATRHAGWRPIRAYGLAEYQRLRGDLTSALALVESALQEVHAGSHLIWPYLASTRLKLLCELGRHADARRHGEADLNAALEQGIGHMRHHIRLPLALALAKQGEHAAAASHADAVIEELQALGVTGLHLGIAYETRARIASAARDRDGFERFAAACAAQFRVGENRLLAARYDKLLQAREAALDAAVEVADAAQLAGHTLGPALSRVTSVLEACAGPRERAQRSLELLIDQTGTSEGYLYAPGDGSSTLIAQIGSSELPADVDARARAYLAGELQAEDVTRDEDGFDASATSSEWIGDRGEHYHPVLLAHLGDSGMIVTALAVLVSERQRTFTHPGELAAEVSRVVYESGDLNASPRSAPELGH